ncbi:CrcB family protein [Salinibacterium sp. ZJ70]|uniref:fluoride efflux transporter FluC n=1 Tax=Salinibacterium sp. ZJ70 TaxID=2708084 RepID=UPI001423F330|nr:CrcB family protein [Salinibacterium sp. ZJ70]
MSALIIVAALVAGAAGAGLRYLAARAFAERPTRLPWAVLLVNVAGSALGGVALGLADAGLWGAEARLIVLSGFCGGLTTFSTLSVETIQLVLDGRSRVAVASVAANLALGVGAAALGWATVVILAG